MNLSPFQKPAFVGLFLLAGYAAGHTLATQQQEKPSAPGAGSAQPAVSNLSMEQALAEADPQRQLQWIALQAEDEINFPAALDNLMRRKTRTNRKAFQELLTLWASRDPEAARAFVLNLKGARLHSSLLSLVEGWAQKDVASLAEWLSSKEGRKLGSIRHQGLSAIVRHDPNLAFSLIDGSDSNKSLAYHYVFTTLAKTDLRAALHLLEQTPPEDRNMALHGMMQEWARSEPDAALSWVQGITNTDLRKAAIEAVASTLSMNSPAKVAELVANELATLEKKPDEVHSLLYSFLYSWNAKDPAAAEEWIATLPAKYREAASRVNQNMLAQANPTAYLKNFEATKVIARNDQHTFGWALSALAQTEPEKVAEWIGQNQEWLPKQTLATAISQVMQNHPSLAPQLLPMLTKGDTAHQTYVTAGERWADKDAAAAKQFLAVLPPGEERDAFQQGLFKQTLGVNPQEAYQMLKAAPEGGLRTRLLNTLASESKEYQATADWISARYGDSNDATSALSTVMAQWGKASPAEAATWLKNTPEGAVKDQLVFSYSNSIVPHDPDMAIQWATSINDEKARNRAMEHIARSWLAIDRSAAREWINSAPFTDKTKERLLK